ncbi:MAG TPA: glycosyl hydrolase 115 family protein, partial [Chitinophagaceae bacterium]|nr:glycosyl hydrolase 115 family protein [Chitinophagaceae bacterium]
ETMRKPFLISFFIAIAATVYSQPIISEKNEAGSFPIVSSVQNATIYTDNNDYWLAQKAADFFQSDIEKVTGQKPAITNSISGLSKNVIIIGSPDQSSLIKKLVAEKKLNVSKIKGKWDAYEIQTLKNPLPGVQNALVITGGNKRGVAYGVFELSQQIGVSPWCWWADVPVKKKTALYIKSGTLITDAPKVKYRGIFINDEAPAFSGWTKEKFGGVNHNVYEKMFELILRLKGNYLWPAMWGNAFNDDDTLNPVLADKYGIVMGTSHHEPMLRAQQEWKRYGKGAWDYTKNDSVLRAFWKKGIENMDHHESIVTIGMRGDGDMPMTQGTAIDLLEKIVADQRKIIADVTGKPASETPQDWALYKEVQDYYDKGMRVPDDVTLLLCDDNWGNIRKLPKLSDKPRSGGYGIYYHFDYVGGPRNYKWINTNNIARVWEQMHLAYEYGVRQIWIVNVGDLKPMEFPISFFLDYAWDPDKWNENNLHSYYTDWAAQQFGTAYAKETAVVLEKYAQYISRRKPELLDANTYSLTDYNEWERVMSEWNDLFNKALKIHKGLPDEYKDAFYELVLHPIEATENLHALYFAAAKNKWYADQKNMKANAYADSVKLFFEKDSAISYYYNHVIAGGKWDHMMDQTHIGYTYWQQPPVNKIPRVQYVTDAASSGNIKETLPLPHKVAPLINLKSNSNIFYEKDGCVSFEAAHYTRKFETSMIKWRIIPDIGRDGDGITTFPVTEKVGPASSSLTPRLEYEFYTYDTGVVKLQAYFSPTLNFHNDSTGLQYAISIDNEKPQIISINKDDNNDRTWGQWVANDIIIKTTTHTINKPGKHVLKYRMISPAVVLQKLVVDFGGVKPSYLGPPETKVK